MGRNRRRNRAERDLCFLTPTVLRPAKPVRSDEMLDFDMSNPDEPFQELRCPHCGYVVGELEFTLLKCDPACPRCGEFDLSEFIPFHLGPTEKPEGEEWKES